VTRHVAVAGAPRDRFQGLPLVVPVAGDDVDAKPVVSSLVRAAGAEPLDAGDLRQAHHLEAMAAVCIRLLFGGADPHSASQFTVGAGGRDLAPLKLTAVFHILNRQAHDCRAAQRFGRNGFAPTPRLTHALPRAYASLNLYFV
jgi:hypothetical protein